MSLPKVLPFPEMAAASQVGALAHPGELSDLLARSVDTSRVLRTWAKMKAGVLPSDGMRRHWIGSGSGECCNGCGDSITVRETELEGELSDALLRRFHEECFRADKTLGQARS